MDKMNIKMSVSPRFSKVRILLSNFQLTNAVGIFPNIQPANFAWIETELGLSSLATGQSSFGKLALSLGGLSSVGPIYFLFSCKLLYNDDFCN